MAAVDDTIKVTRPDQRFSYIVLCASLVLVTVVGGVRATYIPGVYYAIALVQFTVICLAAWRVGVSAVRAKSEERRELAMAGGLLITPWALFSLLPGIGAPPQATAAENQVRYLILVIDAIAIAGGLVVLRHGLSKTGERFYSMLGFVAIMLASPLFVIFATERVGAYRSMESAGSMHEVPGLALLDDLAHVLLIISVALTYLATAWFAASLRRTQWFGRKAIRAFQGVSLFAAFCVGIGLAETLGSREPAISGFREWVAIPGSTVFLIPAVAWIMPLLIGLLLIRRAGKA